MLKKYGNSFARNHSMEDTRFLGSDIFACLAFYLWQLLPYLIYSATFEDFVRETIHIQHRKFHQWIHVVVWFRLWVVFFSLLSILPLRSVLLDMGTIEVPIL